MEYCDSLRWRRLVCLFLACVLCGEFDRVVLASKPVLLMAGTAEETPKQPQLAVSTSGRIFCVFGIDDRVLLSTSEDGGLSFSKPVSVIRASKMPLGMRRGPRISALPDHGLVITAIVGEKGGGQDGDLVSWRSSDDGATWNGPVAVTDQKSSAREGLHAMTASEDGMLWCTWLDLRNSKTQVYISTSVDSGASWSENKPAYRSPTGSVCECCHPSIVANRDGAQLMFRNSLDGNRDMYVLRLDRDGKVVENAKRLGGNFWKLAMCPMDGGMLSLGAEGQATTVWRREGNIYASSAKNSETLIGRGEQPWIVHVRNNPYVTYVAKRDGALVMQDIAGELRRELGERASDPVGVALPLPETSMVVAWESKAEGTPAILAQRVDISVPLR